MNETFFGPHIDAEAHVDKDGNLKVVVIYHPVHAGRSIRIPGDWYDEAPTSDEKIREVVVASLGGAKVKIVKA
jgi:hypothetical protein